ncbi:TetR/AcrR family transcriptional regulator [Georgenia subflava]|uniref:TetR family transcriptional regulator n=1 Tax=Georgenia subflava TaxID=1622177 RepID=A0A6N7EIC9_9MICO|nr:TetR/AcrR family transcriptional regulator C-terminal domain-containing protein [Georgenia subflava]MPV36487.1 TetR family transcriptional regulator [Georgenia subflava]
MSEQLGAERADRPALTRGRIVDAAVRLVDEQGLAALSMRHLGAELGVEAMALYRHINGREDLLEAMVDALTSRLHLTDDWDLGPEDGWQAYLQKLAHTVRELAYDHPELFPLLVTRHPAAPWLRPPLRSLEVVEDFLTALTGRGFSDDQAVAAYRTFSSFLIGQLLLAVAQRGSIAMAGEEVLDEGGASSPNTTTSLDDFPLVKRLEGKLSEDHADEEFERTLEDLLERIDAEVSR